MTITTFWAATPSVISQQPGWATPDPGYLTIPPQDLDPAEFRKWNRTDQLAYIQAHGGSPLELGPPLQAVTVALGASETLSLQLPGEGNREFTTSGMPRAATATELLTAPASLDVRIFLAWKQADQIAYIHHWSSSNPPGINFGGGTGQPSVRATVVPDITMTDGVIHPTSGDDESIPYHHLPGGLSGSDSTIIKESVERLFPTIDGQTTTLSVDRRPPQFYTTPAMLASATDDEVTDFLRSFANWHSAYQLEYAKLHGTNNVLDIPAAPAEPKLTVVISPSDDKTMFTLQSLQKNDFARMTLEEQQKIALLPSFPAHATRLGLSSDIAAMNTLVDTLVSDITNKTAKNIPGAWVTLPPVGIPAPVFVPTPDPVGPDGGPYFDEHGRILRYVMSASIPLTYSLMAFETLPEDGRNAFITQLNILKEQLAGMAVVSPADVQNKVQALRDRFERAFAFWDVTEVVTTQQPMGTPNENVPAHRHVITADGSIAGINRGYQIFIAQEKRIAELAEARMQIARDDGSLFGRSLDVPGLVFQFQGLYNLSLEAEVVAETEEINQQNDLLKTYAAIQDIINRTLATFPKASEGNRHIIGTGHTDDLAPSRNLFTPEERMVIAMFEDSLGTGQKHPLELLRSINRPLHDTIEQNPGNNSHYDLNSFSHTQWSTFGTRLSETVTLINQNSQMKMNDVNSLDKQRNRHFELANNALSKMSEMVQSIARAV